jgi:23S rRNA (uracil1939-C5)-methyltransferase
MLRVRPERFVAGGEALARDADGRVVFVRGGVPGDEVAVEIDDTRRDFSRGHVVEVCEPSPDRVVPPCPQRRLGCGGCDWQHVATPAQLPAKQSIVVDALRRTGRIPDPVVRTGPAVPSRGYRTTIRVVGDSERRPAFRMERSRATVPAAGCLVAHPALLPLLDEIVVTPELEVALRVSVATGEITALWDTAAGSVDGLPPHVATGRRAALTERVAGHDFRVSAPSFFQSGPAAAELLVAEVMTVAPELSSARRVLDAYAGVGLFAVAATPAESEVVAVESSSDAVADARVNLANRRARVERLEVARWRPRGGEGFDVAIADPARTGLAKPGVNAVAGAMAPLLVLVSCDPVSLARDAALLAGRGYRHERTTVLDLFPETHHVEAVTRFVLAD